MAVKRNMQTRHEIDNADEIDPEQLVSELKEAGLASDEELEAALSNSGEWNVQRTSNCPVCENGTLRRVHRTSLEKMRLIKRKYECDACAEIIYKR